MEKLIEIALAAGATYARLMEVKDVVVDERVRLKCFIPRCNAYDRCLTCPPRTMSVREFKEILRGYQKALIVQVEANENSLDKSPHSLGTAYSVLKGQFQHLLPFKVKLTEVIEKVEQEAFKLGYALAAGLGAGRCGLCGEECPGVLDGNCRHPFRARPAMEAMGIDIRRTAEKAGLSIELSSASSIKYTGLVLID